MDIEELFIDDLLEEIYGLHKESYEYNTAIENVMRAVCNFFAYEMPNKYRKNIFGAG